MSKKEIYNLEAVVVRLFDALVAVRDELDRERARQRGTHRTSRSQAQREADFEKEYPGVVDLVSEMRRRTY